MFDLLEVRCRERHPYLWQSARLWDLRSEGIACETDAATGRSAGGAGLGAQLVAQLVKPVFAVEATAGRWFGWRKEAYEEGSKIL